MLKNDVQRNETHTMYLFVLWQRNVFPRMAPCPIHGCCGNHRFLSTPHKVTPNFLRFACWANVSAVNRALGLGGVSHSWCGRCRTILVSVRIVGVALAPATLPHVPVGAPPCSKSFNGLSFVSNSISLPIQLGKSQ